MTQLRIGLAQGASRTNIHDNLKQYLEHIDDLASQGAQIVILPELFLTDYFAIEENSEHFNLALPLESPEHQALSAKAAEKKIVLIASLFEKRTPGLYHNTTLVFDTHGKRTGIYRKMHIPDDPGFFEKYYFAPGDLGFEPIQTEYGTLGVLICWDQWYPEAARIMALKGAQILIYPTAIGWDNSEPSSLYHSQLNAWLTIQRSHSVANGVFTVAVNRVGTEGHLRFWGNSFVCGPDGEDRLHLGEDPKNAVVSINLDEIEVARRSWPFFRDRRIDAYHDILKRWGA